MTWKQTALLVLASASCTSYRPARFAAAPAITDVHDDAPVPVPSFRALPEPIYLSEIYLHRPIRQALDLSPFPQAGDVNARDEVARSSWFAPDMVDVGTMARGPESVGAPRPPFTVLPDAPLGIAHGGFCIADARGNRYDIAIDPEDRPEMITGALAIASRLVWAAGLKTPPVFLVQVQSSDFVRGPDSPDAASLLAQGAPAITGQYRVAAVAWPAGTHVGTTPEAGLRGDDANDLVPHETRRTLRALKVFAAWLSLGGVGQKKTVDRYMGDPGNGHLEHLLVGLDEALGTSDVVRITTPPPADGGGPPWKRLLTLGLAPNPPPPPTQLEIPALGQFDGNVDPRTFSLPLPYEPADQLLAADGYWAAKRIAAVARAQVALAVDYGRLTDVRAARTIERVLNERARKVVAYWFARVTPLELVSFEGKRLVLRDEAVARGVAPREANVYRVGFLTSSGGAADDTIDVTPRGTNIELTLPDGALVAARDYLVVLVTATRAGRRLPRPLELHLTTVGGRLQVVGIRH